MKRILALSLLLPLLAAGGCTRFVAAVSGPEPVGAREGERTLSQRVEDLAIERTAAINLHKRHPDFSHARVLIMSFHGNVLLAGQVPNESLKRMAGENAAGMREVGTVHNELVIAPTVTPMVTRARDSVTAARIRSALTFARDIPSSQCKILVEDGVVYLMAKLKRQEAERVNALIQAIPDIRRIVRRIDYLPD